VATSPGRVPDNATINSDGNMTSSCWSGTIVTATRVTGVNLRAGIFSNKGPVANGSIRRSNGW
jgi:hypothetical protein